ncbi:Piso0_000528 [Millerozyma farinosa CBS 7064]|uniref:Piso0_000528 protein n=1 Tax=Pichia sorbitophila (strain ATCC MYA-4447 / BCRC 22081 / CBS 7064 / NBRC 10061 / NRRL Y-12695) TaxID=559304 RepID=G8YU83_PICSO|nr:Piso0_000528 [Millerozyma farinosa CBS 7064]CCE73484.1 Piso0_000528 [Millerozyma farinosa CBS 7064]
MKRKSENYAFESVSMSKCKRLVRPLVAKIHALNDLNNKYANVLDFTLTEKGLESDYQDGNNVTNDSVRYRPSINPSGENEDKMDSVGRIDKKLKNSIRGHHDNKTFNINEENLNNEETVKSLDSNNSVRNSPNVNVLAKFTNPIDSGSRLKSLKPFVSNSLFESYVDTFQIFQNLIVNLVEACGSEQRRVPKLTTLCSHKLGKGITMSARSTYYKLNQSLLFDIGNISPEISGYYENLCDDIDPWLELEPTNMSLQYRLDLLVGYIIHIIVLNSNYTLYLIIPAFLHWLKEMADATKNVKYEVIMHNLFKEFWNLDSDYFSEESRCLLDHFGGKSQKEINKTLFWLFFRIGFWRNLIYCLFDGASNKDLIYGKLMLETFTKNDKLCFNENTLGKFDFIIKDICCIIQDSPSHVNNNEVLIHLTTQVIVHSKTKLFQAKYISEILRVYSLILYRLSYLAHVWLGFRGNNNNSIFNSSLPGNEDLFEALTRMTFFCITKIKQTTEQLQKNRSFHMHDRIQLWYQRLRKNKENFKVFLMTMKILKSFYMGQRLSFLHDLELNAIESVSNCLIHIQNSSLCENRSCFGFQRSENKVFNNFLKWLVSTQNHSAVPIAKSCLRKYYGKNPAFEFELINNSGPKRQRSILDCIREERKTKIRKTNKGQYYT